jgi:hypothetical protein
MSFGAAPRGGVASRALGTSAGVLGVALAGAAAIGLVRAASPGGQRPFAIALVLWLLLAAFARLVTRWPRVRKGPPTVVPGAEPPAVASLLVSRGRPGETALAATVLDLAAHGSIDLEWGRGGVPICLGVRRDAPGLRELERMVVLRLNAWFDAPGTSVASLLNDPRENDPMRWHAAFRRAVVEEARRRGLVGARIGRLARWLLLLTAVGPAAVFGWSLGHSHALNVGPIPELLAGLLWIGLAFLVPTGLRLTPQGADATARWLGLRSPVPVSWAGSDGLRVAGDPVHDPALARSVAVGLAPELVAATTGVPAGRW